MRGGVRTLRKSCREGGTREVKSQVYTGSETRASNVVYSRSDSSSSSEREQTTLVPVLKVKRATCAQRQRVGSPDDGKGGGEERCGGEALTERKRESDSDTLAQLSQPRTATWLCLLSHTKVTQTRGPIPQQILTRINPGQSVQCL